MNLTDQQAEAVACAQSLLLTACPGSGKTRTLVEKLVTEINALRDGTRRICCITYTNTAVQEIEERAALALQPGDRRYFFVSTIHAFCLAEIVRPFAWKLLTDRPALRVLTRDNPDFEFIAVYAAANVRYFQLSASDFDAFELIGFDINGNVVGLAANNDAVKKAAPFFVSRCAELGYIDFGSIIYSAYCLLRDNPQIANSLCSRYSWFLVDEFQDTSELQIEILKLLYPSGRSRFFLVGDLAQSIYGFAGARPELVVPFGEYIGARSDLSLSENFRSSREIVTQAERLFTRTPAMTAAGPDKDFGFVPVACTGKTAFQAITEDFLPVLQGMNIELGEATILGKDWASLIAITRQLREFGTPVVGPGARPYKRSRLFASLAEQLCGAVVDPQPETAHQLEIALFHAVQDVTGVHDTSVFGYAGRLAIIRMLRRAKALAEGIGASAWLDAMSSATGRILQEAGYIDQTQAGLFYASAQEMKADMARQNVDIANLTVDDLGLFASPRKALRLSTIHYAKGREYKGVAIIGLRRGNLPHYRADTPAAIDGEKRLFYVAITRARQVLMYISEPDRWGNPPSSFSAQAE